MTKDEQILKLKEKNKKQNKKIKQLQSELREEKRNGIHMLNVISSKDEKYEELLQRKGSLQKDYDREFSDNNIKSFEIDELERGIIGLVKKLR